MDYDKKTLEIIQEMRDQMGKVVKFRNENKNDKLISSNNSKKRNIIK